MLTKSESSETTLDVVATMYFSRLYVEEFYNRVREVLDPIGVAYRIILVDDGSPDDSAEIAKNLAAADDRLTVIQLSRNFGHHRAMMAGLGHSRAAFCYLTDIDLEEPPETLRDMWSTIQNDPNTDIVFGQSPEKDGSVLRRLLSQSFYVVFNLLSDVKLPHNETVSRLMRREVVQAICEHNETDLFLPGVWWRVGFTRKAIPVTKTFDGASSYTIRKRIRMAFGAITSFSSRPLVFVALLGASVAVVAFFYVAYLLLGSALGVNRESGWTSVIASVYLVGGAILSAIGILGVYVGKIFDEVKQRPSLHIKRVYGDKNDKSDI